MGDQSRRPLHFIGSSLKDLQRLPDKVQDVFGSALSTRSTATSQMGRGLSVRACRKRCASWPRTSYVLHVFRKKSKSGIATPRPDRELVLARFRTAAATMNRCMAGEVMKNDYEVHDSTGNVFRDMGMADAEKRLAKAELARVIRKVIRERGLTQTQAADLLGVAQPDVSDLVRGKLSRFSMERLERLLNALDLEIRIQVGPRPKGKDRAGITVQEVSSF
jgi:predicted XRE-type DNA-binding protein/phage-related protein